MWSLTPKQDELLKFIEKALSESRVAPSISEMMEGTGTKSKGAVVARLEALEARGYIQRERTIARAIKLCRHD